MAKWRLLFFFMLLLTFSLLFVANSSVFAQQATPSPTQVTPSPTWVPLYSSPTPVRYDYSCYGTPVNYMTVTPSFNWSSRCSHCLTPTPTATVTSTATASTPVPLLSIVLENLEVSFYNTSAPPSYFLSYDGPCARVDFYQGGTRNQNTLQSWQRLNYDVRLSTGEYPFYYDVYWLVGSSWDYFTHAGTSNHSSGSGTFTVYSPSRVSVGRYVVSVDDYPRSVNVWSYQFLVCPSGLSPNTTPTPTPTVTPTPTGTPSGVPYCSYIPDSSDTLSLPVPRVGPAQCPINIPPFDIPLWIVEIFDFIGISGFHSFPGLVVCFQPIKFGVLVLFGVEFDLDTMAMSILAISLLVFFIRS